MAESIKIARCARCATTFVQIRFPVCEKCMDDEDSDFSRISDVLAENPNQNVEIVAALAEVTPACVLRMLKRGLIANEQMAEKVACGRCGRPAISAAQKLCQRCLIKLDQKFFNEIIEARRVRKVKDDEQSVHATIDEKRKNVIKSRKR